jgi:hypothetical protein
MPYTLASPGLPEYIKNKPDSIKKEWIKLYNDVFETDGEEVALITANKWLLRQLEKMDKYVRRTVEFEIVKTDKEFIQRTAEGDEYVTAVLASTAEHVDGKYEPYTESELQSWAEQINENPIVGDFDHETMRQIQNTTVDDKTIELMLRTKQGIAKTVKAIVENGKLFVRLLIDKRYRNRVLNSKGLSVEAVLHRDPRTNEVLENKILGFTFGERQTVAIPDTGILA